MWGRKIWFTNQVGLGVFGEKKKIETCCKQEPFQNHSKALFQKEGAPPVNNMGGGGSGFWAPRPPPPTRKSRNHRWGGTPLEKKLTKKKFKPLLSNLPFGGP